MVNEIRNITNTHFKQNNKNKNESKNNIHNIVIYCPPIQYFIFTSAI